MIWDGVGFGVLGFLGVGFACLVWFWFDGFVLLVALFGVWFGLG